MRNLLPVVLSLACAALVVVGLVRFLGTERELPQGDAPTSGRPGASRVSDEAYAEGFLDGAELASRALLEGDAPPPVEGTAGNDGGGSSGEAQDRAAAEVRAARLARVEERFRRQAEHIGGALELSAQDRQALFEVLLGEYERRSDFFEEMRKDAFDPEMRAGVRDELMGIQEWKTQELQAKLGAELAQAVQDFEQNNDRGLFNRSFERDGKERNEN